jgi:hypothetical protein
MGRRKEQMAAGKCLAVVSNPFDERALIQLAFCFHFNREGHRSVGQTARRTYVVK